MERRFDFGTRLREARRRAGLSQSDLQERSGIPKATLSRYENGHILPSMQTLSRLAAALGAPESALLADGRSRRSLDLAEELRRRGITLRSSKDASQLADAIAHLIASRHPALRFLARPHNRSPRTPIRRPPAG